MWTKESRNEPTHPTWEILKTSLLRLIFLTWEHFSVSPSTVEGLNTEPENDPATPPYPDTEKKRMREPRLPSPCKGYIQVKNKLCAHELPSAKKWPNLMS